MNAIDSFKVAPNAVRVWRGFRLPDLSISNFFDKLGSVFVPATVKLQINAGLHSYTPTVPAGMEGKPDYVPDETAILFWTSQATYWNGFTRLAVRTYTLTHNGVYVTSGSPLSRADFPVAFSGVKSLRTDAPVFLFEQDADWMNGAIRHIVAERPRSQSVDDFRQGVADVLSNIQKISPDLEGAVACIGDEYLVYWELGSLAPGVKTPVSGIPLLQKILTGWSQIFNPAPTYLPIDIYDHWPGMNVTAGSTFNMQFARNNQVT